MELKKIFCTACAAFQELRITHQATDPKTGETLLKIACNVCVSRIMQLVVSEEAVAPPAPQVAPPAPPVEIPDPTLSARETQEMRAVPMPPFGSTPDPSPSSVMAKFSKEHQEALRDPRAMQRIQKRAP